MRRGLISLFVAIFFVISATMHSAARDAAADMQVTASGNTSSGNATYFSTTVNNGPDTATGVVVTGGISGGSLTSVSTSQGSCTFSGDSFTCNVGTVASGQTVSISMSGHLPNFGPHPNQITYCGGHYSVTAATADPNTSNNSANPCLIIPGNSCGNPQGCGPTCPAGMYWCAASLSCVPFSGHCP
jgi:Domain of unknown function DUF11